MPQTPGSQPRAVAEGIAGGGAAPGGPILAPPPPSPPLSTVRRGSADSTPAAGATPVAVVAGAHRLTDPVTITGHPAGRLTRSSVANHLSAGILQLLQAARLCCCEESKSPNLQVHLATRLPTFLHCPLSLAGADGAQLSVRMERAKVAYKKPLDRPFCTVSLLAADGAPLEPPVRSLCSGFCGVCATSTPHPGSEKQCLHIVIGY